MKRIISVFLLLMLILTLTACGDNQNKDNQSQSSIDSNNKANGQQVDTSQDTENDASKKSVLVVYFSCTGSTKKIANYIVNETNADIFEIEAEEPYTDDDLDYTDDSRRTSIEMNDSKSRPKISKMPENLDNYDVIFIGYPIWWGEAPHIINTFLESAKLDNQTIIPFCTSGGSDISGSETNLKKSVSGTLKWLDGKRFSGSSSKDDVADWIDKLNIK